MDQTFEPTLQGYARLQTAAGLELIRAAFAERAAVHRELYEALWADCDGGAVANVGQFGLSANELQAESMHWASRVCEPREQDPPSRLFCYLHLVFSAEAVRARGRAHRRHGVN